MKPVTELIHHGYKAPADFAAPQIAVHKASTVIFPNVQAMRERTWLDKKGYTYGLHGTPTTFTLEERICYLEGAQHAVLVPSGLAAIALVNMALLKQGDEILLPDNVYGPHKTFAEGELKQWGITFQLYDPMDLADLSSRITPQTRLIWLEAAGSVTLEFPDVFEMVRLARSKGVLTALDNTWGAGLAFAPFDLEPGQGAMPLGVDISVHALTKFPSGGGDVLMGSVTTCDDQLAKQLKLSHMRMGFGVGANDAELVLRSLPSMELRYKQQDATARALAAWCLQQSAFAQVLHPAVVSSPGHPHWRRLCAGDQPAQGPVHFEGLAAALLGLRLDPAISQAQLDIFCDSLRLFKLGFSWGGPMSLVVPYHLRELRLMSNEALLQGGFVRLSVGLEAAEDLIDDVAQALAQAGI
jgi:cysteine-S-conjugate beta-lyase